MNLSEFRKQNPAYADVSIWPDDKLADGLYNKYYRDTKTRDEFNTAIGFTSVPKSAEPEKISMKAATKRDSPKNAAAQAETDAQVERGILKKQVEYAAGGGMTIGELFNKYGGQAAGTEGNMKDTPVSELDIDELTSALMDLRKPKDNRYSVLEDINTTKAAAQAAYDPGEQLDKTVPQTTEEPAEGWQAYADRIDQSAEPGLEEPWVNPIDAAAMPAAMGAKLGKGLAKTATRVAVSLLAEPAVGTGLDYVEQSLDKAGTPAYIKLPATLLTGIAAGTLTETAIAKVGQHVKAALKGAKPTVEAVAGALKTMQITDTGSEEVIRKLVKQPSKPLDMATAVKEITKRSKAKVLKPEIDEIRPGDVMHSNTGESMQGMALGAGAGVEQDEDGNITLDAKKTLLGMTMGVLAGTQVKKMITSTRLPGIPDEYKQTIRLAETKAGQLEKTGRSPLSIFKKTGMFKDPDGHWLFELDDSKARVKLPKLKVGETKDLVVEDILDYDELYNYHPQFLMMPIHLFNDPQSPYAGRYIPGSDSTDVTSDAGDVFINLAGSAEEVKKSLFHELNHGVQFADGREGGGSVEGLKHTLDVLRAEREKLSIANQTIKVKKQITKIDKKLKAIGMEDYQNTLDMHKENLVDLEDQLYKLESKQASPERLQEIEKIQYDLSNTELEVLSWQDTVDGELLKKYTSILGEQESEMVADRLKLSTNTRANRIPVYAQDALFMSKLGIDVGPADMITGTRMPGVKGGVKREVKLLKNEAKALKKAGKEPHEIYLENGMFQGPDGRWRQELDDSLAKIDLVPEVRTRLEKGEPVPYGEMVKNHPELYARYPGMAGMPVRAFPENSPYSGSFSKGPDAITDPGSIKINLEEPVDSIKKTLLHEGQHAVQRIEGHEGGGSPMGLLLTNVELTKERDAAKSILDTLKNDPSVPAEYIKNARKDWKRAKSRLRHLGLVQYSDKVTENQTIINKAQKEMDVASVQMRDLENNNMLKSVEYEKAYEQFKKARLTRDKATLMVDVNNRDLRAKSFERYQAIVGEQESHMTENRMGLAASIRRMSMPEWTKDAVHMSKLRAATSATTAGMGAVYNGVDWDEFEETGRIQIDPDAALRGLMMGAGVGMGMSVLPKAASTWTHVTKNKILDPVMDTIKGSITNETIRYQFGMGRSAEVAAMVKDYRTKANLVLRKSIAIGRELNEIAPTALAQKRLTQILEGGITTSPSLAKKAHQINAMFKDLKDSTREMNLSQYSRFDNLTRKQRTDLRNIIKNPDTPAAEKITAQTMINNHYHIGSSKEYLPVFHPGVEGITKTEKSILNREIRNLKKKSRFQNPEGDPVLEAQIAGLESVLKKGMKKTSRVRGVALDQGYSAMRQDLPAEATRVFNDIVGPAYRAAKGSATQANDVLKMGVLKSVAENPEWVLPKDVPVPKNYVKLYGKEWGPLNHKSVRNDVLSDLEEVIDYRSDAERNMDKIMGYWKYGKAILNPVTHARNFVSNMALAHLAGVNPADTAAYGAAAKAIKQGRANADFKAAEDWGLYNNTFIESDISVLRDELTQIRNPGGIANWIRKAAAIPSTMYDQSERFFKTAVFIKARDGGATVDDAAKQAEKYLFNYQDIPPVVKHYKRWAAPFVTYAYKATPVMAESMITKPWKAAGLFGGMYGLEQLAMKQLGANDEDVADDKSVMLDKRGQVLLPFKDDYGNRLYGNIGAFLPWSGVGQTWGQSDIPLGDFLPSNPILTIGAALMTNKENFTGKEIHDRVLLSGTETTKKYMEYAWKQLVPSLAPGGYGFEKMVTAFKNSTGSEITDFTGQVKDPSTLALRALLGVKLTPANQKLFNQFSAAKLRKIQRAVSTRRRGILKQLQRNEVTKEQADDQLQALRDLQIERVEEQLKRK